MELSGSNSKASRTAPPVMDPAHRHDMADRLALWLAAALNHEVNEDRLRPHILAWLDFNQAGSQQ